jgi:hypothetical protein
VIRSRRADADVVLDYVIIRMKTSMLIGPVRQQRALPRSRLRIDNQRRIVRCNMLVDTLEVPRVGDIGATATERERRVTRSLFFQRCRRFCIGEIVLDDFNEIVINQLAERNRITERFDARAACSNSLLIGVESLTFRGFEFVVESGTFAAEIEAGSRPRPLSR